MIARGNSRCFKFAAVMLNSTHREEKRKEASIPSIGKGNQPAIAILSIPQHNLPITGNNAPLKV